MGALTLFISYRREDAMGHAGRLFDRLAQRFGSERVFRDLDTLAAGEDFAAVIRQQIARSDVVLVLIGARWLSAADEQGRRRLADERDFVRLEIASALERSNVRVVPVLLQGARMPDVTELPSELAALANRNAVELRDTSFDRDVVELIHRLRPPWRLRQATGLGSWMVAPMVFAGLALSGWLFLLATRPPVAVTPVSRGATSPTAAEVPLAATTPAKNAARLVPDVSVQGPLEARRELAALGAEFTSRVFVQGAARGDLEVVRLMLRAGMKPDEIADNVDRELWEGPATALLLACRYARTDVVAQLLAKGAQPTLRVRSSAPLWTAAAQGHLDVLRLLLRPPPTESALVEARLTAAWASQLPAIELLEAHGAPAKDADCAGAFASLSSGARVHPPISDERQTATLRHFLDQGCNARATDDSGRGLLLLAANYASNALAMKLLLDRGAEVDQRDPEQATALWWVAGIGEPKLAKVLLAAGADPSAKNKDGVTPRERAYGNGVDEMMALFRAPDGAPKAR